MTDVLTIQFLKPGLFTNIQDLGRPGHQEFGVPVSGAMDQQSAQLANEMVGNPTNSPVFEITLLGPTMQFHHSATISFTGGRIEAFADGEPLANYQSHQIRAGTRLRFGRVLTACRTYLAIRGDWQIQRWLGSGSWHDQNTTPDSWIRKDQIMTISNKGPFEQSIQLSAPAINLKHPFRLLSGPEYDLLTLQQIKELETRPFTVEPVSNRMGYRLTPNLVMDQPNPPMLSSGVLPGTVQLTPSGQLIILMADAQTTGGYPRIGIVHSSDIDRLGQVRPGQPIRWTLG
ncbi:MAG: biotin-dependent carboxyltransferase family protein [Bacteroidota bacterium]